MAPSGLDAGEERERSSAAVPPGVTAAEESVKSVWAWRLLTGSRRAVRSKQLLKSTGVSIS
jgi:hypothetical protein